MIKTKERRRQTIFIGDILADRTVFIPYGALNSLGIQKGSRHELSKEQNQEFVSRLGKEENISEGDVFAGGTCSNSAYIYALLNGHADMITVSAGDELASACIEDLKNVGVRIDAIQSDQSVTRLCLCLITEDAERTMILGQGAGLSEKYSSRILNALEKYREEKIHSRIFLNAYLINGLGYEAFSDLIKFAVSNNMQIALSLSDKKVVEKHKEFLRSLFWCQPIVFGNEEEYDALEMPLTQECDAKAKDVLFVITLGDKGAKLIKGDVLDKVDACRVEHPVNYTGAGDHFAGAYLYALDAGMKEIDCAKFAAFVAAKKVEEKSSRLKASSKDGLLAYQDQMN